MKLTVGFTRNEVPGLEGTGQPSILEAPILQNPGEAELRHLQRRAFQMQTTRAGPQISVPMQHIFLASLIHIVQVASRVVELKGQRARNMYIHQQRWQHILKWETKYQLNKECKRQRRYDFLILLTGSYDLCTYSQHQPQTFTESWIIL